MLYLADNNSITLTILLLIHKIFNKKGYTYIRKEGYLQH